MYILKERNLSCLKNIVYPKTFKLELDLKECVVYLLVMAECKAQQTDHR